MPIQPFFYRKNKIRRRKGWRAEDRDIYEDDEDGSYLGQLLWYMTAIQMQSIKKARKKEEPISPLLGLFMEGFQVAVFGGAYV